MTLGPLRISATDPYRLLLEAATIWLVAEVVSSRPGHRRGIPLAIGALLWAAVADSSPTRVGDGAEYVAMALNLSRGAAPSVMPAERESLTNEMDRMSGFEGSSIVTPLVGRDGRQDFYHFWLYPLIVSPFLFLSHWVPVHVNDAFTAVNLLLFAALLSWLVRKDAPDIAALLAAGPLLWWIDKAHAEVLLFVTLAFAVLLIDTWPAAALIAAGIATAQNPAAGVVFLVCLVSTLRGRTRDIPIPAVVVALVLAAAAPVYYQWHLGIWSPLSSTVGREFPGVRALVTPLVDPNLGLLPHAPILVAVAAFGLLATVTTHAHDDGGRRHLPAHRLCHARQHQSRWHAWHEPLRTVAARSFDTAPPRRRPLVENTPPHDLARRRGGVDCDVRLPLSPGLDRSSG